ncbi:MAG: nuclear transport factor 2 family protein [candidate division Zixibacteria bacterium]|nr:nuclear transport factor 2 family protein [candidate division Zixibacteria bacterium]
MSSDRRQSATIIASLLTIILILILACKNCPDSRVAAYLEAHNSHDVDKTMRLFADDIRYEIVDMWVVEGREELAKLEGWDAALNSWYTFTDYQVNGDTVTFKIAECNDWFKLAGINEMRYEFGSMIFDNGLIKEIRVKLTPASIAAGQKAYSAVMEWASRERRDKVAQLMPDGELVYNAANARQWLSLLRDWKEATNQQ